MKRRQFLGFMLPSLLVMGLFIALPLLSVVVQSLHVEHEQQLHRVESCGPFGCRSELQVDSAAMQALNEAAPLGRFNGLGTYVDANHLALKEIRQIWHRRNDVRQALAQILNLPFYQALGFTLAYTGIVTPLVLVLGFLIALSVNRLPRRVRGPIIFLSLLPMIVTPLIGSLVLFWLVDERGLFGATLQWLFSDPTLSLKASPALTWVMLFIHGIWHSIPLSFIIFFAALQTVPRELIESAQVDGTRAWQRVRYLTLPHLKPVILFVTLIQIMDNFRVFEPIIGFSAQASASSLSYRIYSDLISRETPLYGSAAATSVLTIVGIAILLLPWLGRRQHRISERERRG